MVCTYALYLVGALFSILFLSHVALVAVSASTMIGIVASIGGVRQWLAGTVPAQTIGGILIGLAALTLAQDASGAVVTALAGSAARPSGASRVDRRPGAGGSGDADRWGAAVAAQDAGVRDRRGAVAPIRPDPHRARGHHRVPADRDRLTA